MRKTFIFDFDDTLANFTVYNTIVLKQPVKVLPHIGGTIKGAEEILEMLSRKGDRLFMLSMNIVLNEEQKWKKLERVGMRRWFNERNSFFVRKKTPHKIREICRGSNPSHCYMVGNSLTNDVIPSLEAGINVIYIPRPVWKRLIPRSKPTSDRIFALKDIREIREIYPEL
ncbi:MAG: hypothetical protein ACMUIE_04590 [Thermoplasmatota archaeon]